MSNRIIFITLILSFAILNDYGELFRLKFPLLLLFHCLLIFSNIAAELALETTAVDPVTAPHMHNGAEEDDQGADCSWADTRFVEAKAKN